MLFPYPETKVAYVVPSRLKRNNAKHLHFITWQGG
jgi:hypothetical protein